MSPVIQPQLSYNFLVTMWEVQGPGMFGLDHGGGGWGIAAKIASGLASLASQIFLGGFTEVGGLSAELDLETYNEGGGNAAARRFVKGGKYPNLTFKKGITFNAELWDWHQQVLYGTAPVLRRSGMILLLERAGFASTGSDPIANMFVGLSRPPVAAWYFERALPERLIGPPLDAKSNAVAIETLELAHEGLTRVSLGMITGAADAASSAGGLLGAAATAAVASPSFAVGAAATGGIGAITATPAAAAPDPAEVPPPWGEQIKGDPPPSGGG